MEPRHHPLPDGRRLVIREAAPDDARAVLAYVETIAGESDNLTFGPGEFGIELADEVRIIQRFRDDPQQLYLVAEVEGELVGGLTFMAGTRPRIRHAGELGMSVLRSHWRLGIGSRLLDALIAWARAGGTIRKLDLRVRIDNEAAIALYRGRGFELEGTIRRAFCIDGVFVDHFAMGLALD